MGFFVFWQASKQVNELKRCVNAHLCCGLLPFLLAINGRLFGRGLMSFADQRLIKSKKAKCL